MTRNDARIIFCGLIPDGSDLGRLTARGRQEVRDALDKILELTNRHPLVEQARKE